MSSPRATPGQYLSLSVHNQAYGIAIGSIREIIRVTHITPVPQTPHYMAGVINLRGKLIPVVELGKKFGLGVSEHTRETCIIVVESESHLVGLLVDAVHSVHDLTAEHLDGVPNLGTKENLDFLSGMGKVDDKVLLLIHVEATVSAEEWQDSPAIKGGELKAS